MAGSRSFPGKFELHRSKYSKQTPLIISSYGETQANSYFCRKRLPKSTPQNRQIRPGDRKISHRAAKQPPARKLKLSRVTSGYGGLIIPFSRICLTPKNGGYMGVAYKNDDFRANNGHRRSPRRSPCNGFNKKPYLFWCCVMMVTKKLDDFNKMHFLSKKNAFLAHFAYFKCSADRFAIAQK